MSGAPKPMQLKHCHVQWEARLHAQGELSECIRSSADPASLRVLLEQRLQRQTGDLTLNSDLQHRVGVRVDLTCKRDLLKLWSTPVHTHSSLHFSTAASLT
jgi:hypothetical protein